MFTYKLIYYIFNADIDNFDFKYILLLLYNVIYYIHFTYKYSIFLTI